MLFLQSLVLVQFPNVLPMEFVCKLKQQQSLMTNVNIYFNQALLFAGNHMDGDQTFVRTYS